MHGVHVGGGLPAPPDVQQEHVGGGVESSIKQPEYEGVEAHGGHRLVEREAEGGQGVAQAAEEQEQVGLGTRQPEHQTEVQTVLSGYFLACLLGIQIRGSQRGRLQPRGGQRSGGEK